MGSVSLSELHISVGMRCSCPVKGDSVKVFSVSFSTIGAGGVFDQPGVTQREKVAKRFFGRRVKAFIIGSSRNVRVFPREF
jgi:hypothetical protein